MQVVNRKNNPGNGTWVTPQNHRHSLSERSGSGAQKSVPLQSVQETCVNLIAFIPNNKPSFFTCA